MISPDSIVVVRWPKGYVAYLRFSDPKLDSNISHYHKDYLHYAIERRIREINNEISTPGE